ncbi:hypothetical protein [Vreelandella alkaliphila]|uniref:hypothetical protein n=1 Tax=Vreelandella alkaliphila TaxID=272774 RepID=UPI003FD80338
MKTTTVRMRVLYPSGEPAPGASVRVALNETGVSSVNGYINRSGVVAMTADDGVAEMELWPSSTGIGVAEYRVVARAADGRKLLDEYVSVPHSNVPVWLHDIVIVPEPTPKPYDEASIDIIQQARILAQDARYNAEIARDVAAAISNLHPTVTDGLLATGDGHYFTVPGEGTYLTVYRHVGGSAVKVVEFPSRAALDDALKRTPRLYQTDDIKDPKLSGNTQAFQLFEMTAQKELSYQLSGQNLDSLPPLTGTILGECYFGFPTMDQTFKVNSPFPRIHSSGVKVANASFGGSQTIALSDIRATTFNSSVNLPLFEPVMVDQYGIVSFRYLGEQPLHTVIRGGIQWLQRIHTGVIDTTAAIDAFLRLAPLPLVNRPSSGLNPSDNIPSWEAGGQHRGRQYLGFCAASGARHFQMIPEEWNDSPGQISPTVEAAIENDPELNTEPPINGWLSPSSDDADVLEPDDPDGNTPPELEGNLKTTEWITVTPGTWYRGAVLPLGESSSRGRAQWRDGEGVIHFKDLRSGNFLFQAPPDAVDFRIYYAGPQDAHVTGLSIKSVTEGQIRTQLVTRGTWRRYNINVCRDVVFYPNTIYRLELKVFGAHKQEGASQKYWFEYDDGYRIESGGLSFMFDASSLVKQRAKLHDNKGGN